eukprot:c23700_g1_i1 orf=396-635(-)
MQNPTPFHEQFSGEYEKWDAHTRTTLMPRIPPGSQNNFLGGANQNPTDHQHDITFPHPQAFNSSLVTLLEHVAILVVFH